MKVNSIAQKIYKSQTIKKGLEFAADNSALFIAGTSLALSAVVRPLSILAAPQADKENKKLACAKSVSSATVGYLLMLGVSSPIARGVKRIDKNPEKYLKQTTRKLLKDEGQKLQDSKAYQLATQTFKLGLGFLIAYPKAIMTSALIPPIMKNLFQDKKENPPTIEPKHQTISTQKIAFKGRLGESLSKGMGKVLDSDFVIKNANKLKDTDFAMHTIALTDTVSTVAFIHENNKNKNIDEKRKKVLNYNCAISTGLCIAGGYTVDKLLEKPFKNFSDNFAKANKNSPKLAKYLEGLKIVKPAIIFGGIYYGIIPFVSTFLADKFDDKKSSVKA